MYWTRSYYPQHNADLACNEVLRTDNGECLSIGNLRSSSFGLGSVALIKLQVDGGEALRRFYRLPSQRWQVTCAKVYKRNVVVSGLGVASGRVSAVVAMLDEHGDVRWCRRYGADDYNVMPADIHIIGDEYIGVAGRIERISSQNQDVLFLMLDVGNGEIIEQQGSDLIHAYDFRYMASGIVDRGDSTGIALEPLNTDGWLIGGNLRTSHDPNNLWLLEIDQVGALRSHTRLGGLGNDQMTAMTALNGQTGSSRDFILTGFTSSKSHNTYDMMVARIHLSSSSPAQPSKVGIIWSNAYRFKAPSYAYDVVQTLDGHLVVVGSAYDGNSSPYGPLDAIVMKIDPNGHPQWVLGYGDRGGADGFYTAAANNDNAGFVLGGYNSNYPSRKSTDSFTHREVHHKNLWILSLDEMGRSPQESLNCAEVDLAPPTVESLDWVPMCSQPPEPDVKTLALESLVSALQPVESSLVRRLTCE